ncbi:hypothetical protein OS493_028746 [Desmophyllum pertusum]|uniref:Uncharacterized protein n=1 Tax=Desmophyllum pertusum TaxID=174260 RepID=A0A9W9YCH4_9CNID|nr:hypothetical protein OS493_028746 [Desmophyllum pertusum]
MTIAAMEPTQAATAGSVSPDYSQIYTLLSRVMRGQAPPNLSPLDAHVILDLLTDLERRLAGHDISSQVNFVTIKYREVIENQDTATSSTQRQLPPRRAKAANNSFRSEQQFRQTKNTTVVSKSPQCTSTIAEFKETNTPVSISQP